MGIFPRAIGRLAPWASLAHGASIEGGIHRRRHTMPYGVFPRPNLRTRSHSSPRSGFGARIRTRFQRNRLDRQLAAGVTPNPLTRLRVRAAQLHSPATRAQLANALVEAVGEARRGTPMNIRP